jgi:hypothetical protein
MQRHHVCAGGGRWLPTARRCCVQTLTGARRVAAVVTVTASSQVYPAHLRERFWYGYLVPGKSHYIYPERQPPAGLKGA